MGPTRMSALRLGTTPLGPHLDREAPAEVRRRTGAHARFRRAGLASLPGCSGPLNLYPVVSLRSTTDYLLRCLRHPCGGDPDLASSPRTFRERILSSASACRRAHVVRSTLFSSLNLAMVGACWNLLYWEDGDGGIRLR
jgi:hypothetical protein